MFHFFLMGVFGVIAMLVIAAVQVAFTILVVGVAAGLVLRVLVGLAKSRSATKRSYHAQD